MSLPGDLKMTSKNPGLRYSCSPPVSTGLNIESYLTKCIRKQSFTLMPKKSKPKSTGTDWEKPGSRTITVSGILES